jgi:Coenzyme PQQ synthesis protein D (PqqD)
MKLAKYTKFREEKFGGVLFETRSERVYSLNPTAAAVVREIAPGVDERQIVERLKTQFRDAGSVMEREALTFLAELRQKGLLED